MIARVTLCLLLLLTIVSACERKNEISYPKSTYIKDIHFDLESIVELAPGSDNWAITWGDDGHQYTTWGDGGGFNGNNQRGRVSMGVARIEGAPDNFKGINIWGGYNGIASANLGGGSYGILSISSSLWLWKTGDIRSGNSSFKKQSLFYSEDHGISWEPTSVIYLRTEFKDNNGFYAPTFLQFGPGYKDSRDNYVYAYAPEIKGDEWEVQFPGEITLMRVLKNKLTNKVAYEFYAGNDNQNQPQWTLNKDERQPVFSDYRGVMRTSVTYIKGLKRYILITQQISRFKKNDGLIGIFEAKEPWGPWLEVLVTSPWELGLQNGKKTVFWNISNKWTSSDGQNFSLVYTGPSKDSFGVINGSFELY